MLSGKKLSLIATVFFVAFLLVTVCSETAQARHRKMGKYTVYTRMPASFNYDNTNKQIRPSKIYGYSTQPYVIQAGNTTVKKRNHRRRHRSRYTSSYNYYPVNVNRNGVYPSSQQQAKQNPYFNRSSANPYFSR